MNRTPINKSFHTDTNSRPAKLLQKVFLSENISQKHKGWLGISQKWNITSTYSPSYYFISLSLFSSFHFITYFFEKKKGGWYRECCPTKNMMYHKTLWLLTKILFSIINFFILFHLNVTKNVIYEGMDKLTDWGETSTFTFM